MKHDDTTLQAAIDAAMLEIGRKVKGDSFAACRLLYPIYWGEESPARLALAKAFLAKLPAGLQASEADKALADLASRLANIAYDPVQPMAFAKSVADHVDDLREDINHAQKVSLADARATDATIARLNAELAALHQPIIADDGRSLGQVAKEAFIGAPGLTDDWMNAAAQAVANVVLAQAIRRMEAVPVKQLADAAMEPTHPYGLHGKAEAIRARLIAAARGEAEQQEGAGLASSTFESNGKTWTHHDPDAPMPCDGEAMVQVAFKDGTFSPQPFRAKFWCWTKESLEHEWIIGWRYADEQDTTDWKARAEKAEAALAESEKQFQAKVAELLETLDRAEKAEAELAALKSSPIGILRPLAEAGPVPDGCVRMLGNNKTDGKWTLAIWEDEYDTHFADIRLPVTETPVNEQPKKQVPLGPEDVMPGSVFRFVESDDESAWQQPHEILSSGAAFHNGAGTVMWKDWSYLASGFEINRSIPLTGKWDANAWEPCSKPAK